MARRRRNNSSGNKNILYVILGAVALVLIVDVLFKSSGSSSGAGPTDSDFRISDYRKGGSRFTNNKYRLEGRVEAVMPQGHDRLVAVTLANNPDGEILPILVPDGAAGDVNLDRGETSIFNVECRSGRDESGEPIKGIFITREVENKL